jgi:FkbM family methyltransferase
MKQSGTALGNFLIRMPPSVRSLRRIPLLGKILHRLSHQMLPAEQMMWVQIEAGPARGLWFELNPRTGWNYRSGHADSLSQSLIAERLKPGDVFYDLGANNGLFSLIAARVVGDSGKVISFEPDPVVATRLRRNIQRNGFHNVTVAESGVWSKSGKVNFIPAEDSSPDRGTGRFASTPAENATAGLQAGQKECLINCVSLDDFVSNDNFISNDNFVSNVPSPNAIKCDVEGAEMEVLIGAENLLRRSRPWILCEMHSSANDDAARKFLSRLGYSFESLDDNHVLALP